MLPLWLHALPCDQLLLLEHETFFQPSSDHSHTVTLPPPATATAPPTTELQPLIAMLRFAGFSTDNATRLAQTPALRDRPAAPSFGTALNPISPGLRKELDAYFAPFQESLRLLLASHRKCFSERYASKKGKQKTKMVAR